MAWDSGTRLPSPFGSPASRKPNPSLITGFSLLQLPAASPLCDKQPPRASFRPEDKMFPMWLGFVPVLLWASLETEAKAGKMQWTLCLLLSPARWHQQTCLRGKRSWGGSVLRGTEAGKEWLRRSHVSYVLGKLQNTASVLSETFHSHHRVLHDGCWGVVSGESCFSLSCFWFLLFILSLDGR